MPLDLTRRGKTWYITGTLDGRRVRESTGRSEKRQAEDILAARAQQLHRAAVFGPASVTGWGDAVLSYTEVTKPSPNTAALLERITDFFGRTLLKDIDQAALDRACKALLRPGAAPATRLRNVIGPVQAVLNHAARRGWCAPLPLEKPEGATGIKRTRWLTPAEWTRLHDASADHLRPLLTFLVGTGCRMSEAMDLEWPMVDLAHAQARVWQKQGNERTVTLPPAVVAALAGVKGREGRVFRTAAGEPYRDLERASGGQIKTAWAGACRRAQIAGATPHTLRHTWATWRYAYHRDPMRLRDEGGWASLDQVERYTKLAPETILPGVLAAWGLPAPNLAHQPARQVTAA
jgi:integrase